MSPAAGCLLRSGCGVAAGAPASVGLCVDVVVATAGRCLFNDLSSEETGGLEGPLWLKMHLDLKHSLSGQGWRANRPRLLNIDVERGRVAGGGG